MECDYLKGMFEEQKEFISYRFDELHKDLGEMKEKEKKQDGKIERLEGRKWIDRGTSTVGGVIGGFFAMLLGWFKF